VNPALISGLSAPTVVAVSGSGLLVGSRDLFDVTRGIIGEYTTAGATVNPALISELGIPRGIAISGPDLFVLSQNGPIGEYTTAGARVNPALISSLSGAYAFAVVPGTAVPEPGSAILTLFGLVLAGLAIRKIEKRSPNDCGWAYQCNERTDSHGPHVPGLVRGGRPLAHFLAYGAPLFIFMTAWAILLMYAA